MDGFTVEEKFEMLKWAWDNGYVMVPRDGFKLVMGSVGIAVTDDSEHYCLTLHDKGERIR